MKKQLFLILFLFISFQKSNGQRRRPIASGPINTSGSPARPFVPVRPNYIHLVGTELRDPCNETIVIRGISKMTIFEQNDLDGKKAFPEIAKTNANCIRIVWGMGRIVGQNQVVATTAEELDKVINTAKANKMIPMIGLWDFTDEVDGGFSKLSQYVDYWIRPDILAVIKKHQDNLIIGICNECGESINNENDSAEMNIKLEKYVTEYKKAIIAMRNAGIEAPLIINGIDRGKGMKAFSFIRNGQTEMVANELQKADFRSNTIFSPHLYWPLLGGADDAFIQTKFDEAIRNKIPFIIGEFSSGGAFINGTTDPCGPEGRVNFEKIATLCQQNNIGYCAWEWGPGNLRPDGSPCTELDMTTNGNATNLTSWGTDIVNNPLYGIKATSKKTSFFEVDCRCENVKLTISQANGSLFALKYNWSSNSNNIQSYVIEQETRATFNRPSIKKSIKFANNGIQALQFNGGNSFVKLKVFKKSGGSCYVKAR